MGPPRRAVGQARAEVTGIGDRGLEIVYEDASGVERELFVSSADPEAVLRAIEGARAGAGVIRARVPEAEAVDEEVSAESRRPRQRAR